jgi:phosphohistidine phosphatase
MPRQIWLLRHGEAVPHESKPDDDRELTARGERQAIAAGEGLARLGIEFDGCYASPKVRALETARIACGPLGIEPEVAEALRGGDFDPAELAAGRGDVMLVGHEPDFSRAVELTTGGHVEMKKGGLAAIDGTALVALLRPGQLRAIASSGEAP